MKIETNLPFEFCDDCQNFIMDVEQQVIFADEGFRTRILTVGCKNEWLCQQLKDQLKGERHDVADKNAG